MEIFMVEEQKQEREEILVKIPEHIFTETSNDLELGEKVREIYYKTIERYGRSINIKQD